MNVNRMLRGNDWYDVFFLNVGVALFRRALCSIHQRETSEGGGVCVKKKRGEVQ